MNSTKTILALLTVVALGSLGCQGKFTIGGTDDIEQFKPTTDDKPDGTTEDPPPGTITRPGDEPMDEVCQFIDPGETPLRRLTGDEYHNSVRDLFPFATIPTQALTPDERISGFEANTISAVTELQAEEYQRAAEAISEVVVANLDGVLAMDADEPTVRAFIADYGKRAYRRPLESTEVDAIYTLFETGSTAYDAATGAQMVVEAILQSPSFLYRLELGEESQDEVVPLTGFEIATRLSYLLWGSAPDAALLAAAEAGELETPEQVETQARRLIADDKAHTRINEMMAQWLRIDEIETIDNPDPDFTPAVRTSMADETRALIDSVLWDGDGKLSTLLTADYTFVDANTAALYGIRQTADQGLVRVDLPPERRGILSQPGVLAMHGHGQAPVHRGHFIRDAFLCLSDNAPPPPNEIIPLPTFEGESMRSKSEKRMAARNEGCSGCHNMMDGVGLAFDNFDSMGRYRTEDEFGNALTGDAEIQFTQTTDGPVNGAVELANKLAASEEVSDCMTIQFFRYAFARIDGASDACSLHMVNEALAESDNDIREALVALATTDAFMYRRNPSAGM